MTAVSFLFVFAVSFVLTEASGATGQEEPVRRLHTHAHKILPGTEVTGHGAVRRQNPIHRNVEEHEYQVQRQLPKCGTSYDGNQGAPYSKGQWVARERDLTRLVESESGEGVGIETTLAGQARLTALRTTYRRCESLMPTVRRCLFQPEGNGQQAARALAAMNFDWVPETCELDEKLTFDTLPAWLEARQTKLTFLGDSVGVDMAETLACRLPPEKEHLVKAVRSDYLGTESYLNASLLEVDSRSFSRRWAEYIVKNIASGDVVVLNAASHFHDIGYDKTRAAFLKMAQDILKLPLGRKPRAILYRTAVMGHADCEHRYSPLGDTALIETSKKSRKMFNWGRFGEINAAIIDALAEVLPANFFRVVDVSMFDRRADGHVAAIEGKNVKLDCLHYCKPGPQMAWNRLLLHVLSRMEEERQDH
jgi:hypothetical protein